MIEQTLDTPSGAYTIRANDDSHIGQRIKATGRPYEYQLLDHIFASVWPKPSIAIDVGAHIGNHSLWLAKACGFHVLAYEPIAYGALVENIEFNKLGDQITAMAFALGDVNSPPAKAKPSIGNGVGELEVGEGDIEVHALDDLGLKDENIALIKVDVEGMEPDVLHGAEQTIRKQRPALFLEAADPAASRVLAELLKPWGYTQTARFKRGTPVERWDG